MGELPPPPRWELLPASCICSLREPPGAVRVCKAAALDVAFTVGHDRAPAHGPAAIAPAMASSNTGISNCGGRWLARREALHSVQRTAWSPSTAGLPEQM